MPTNTSPGTTASPGPTLASSSVTVSWAGSTGATYYGLGVRDIASGTLVVNTNVTSGTSYTASLTAGKQYRWNVNACNTAGCSGYTTDLYFQTPAAVTIPAMPTNTSPGTTASPGPTLASSSVTVSWAGSTGATYYGLGVRDIASGTLVVNTNVTSGTSYTASLTAGKQYRWNVNACNTAGCSGYTTDLYFQTPAAVTIPAFSVSVSPSSRTVTQGNTASYTVTVQSQNGFSSGVSLTVLNMPGNQVLAGTGFTPQAVTPSANGSVQSTLTIITDSSTLTGTFSMIVQGVSGSATQTYGISITVNAAVGSASLDDYPFKTSAFCPATVTACPSNTVDRYSFYYRECASFVAWRMNRDAGTIDPSRPWFTDGMSGGHWGNAGNWSANASALGYRVDNTPSVGAVAQWNANECGGCTIGHVAYVEMINGDGSVNVSEYNFRVDHGYDFRSNITPPRYIHISVATPGAVTIPATPTNPTPGSTSSPGPTTSGSSVTMSWSASSGATSYGLGVRDVASGSLVVDTNVTSGTSYTASLSAGKQYRWNVNACNSAGCSSYTTVLYFQTPGAVTSPAMPSNPTPGSTIGPGPTAPSSSVTMTWGASSGATSYGLGVVDIAGGSLAVNTSVTSGTSYTASLSAGKQYRWNVNACNSVGCSGYTTVLYFQTPGAVTIPATPANPTPGSTTSPGPATSSNNVTLTWTTSSGATSYGLGVRDVASGSLVVNTNVTGGASYNASLSVGKQYRWNVNACNSAGCSGYTDLLYFETPGVANVSSTPPIDGIDVADRQTKQTGIDWNEVVNPGGKKFAFVKATEGTSYTWLEFQQNIEAARSAGLIVGAYHYAYPDEDTAHEEAQYFLSAAANYIGVGYLPPVLDLENSIEMHKTALSEWIIAWCAEVEQAAGVKPIIYVDGNYAANCCETTVTQFPLWAARDDSTDTSDPGMFGIWPTWAFQQYLSGGHGGRSAGVTSSAGVDLDSFNGDMTALRALTNRGNATAGPTPPTISATPASLVFITQAGTVTPASLAISTQAGANPPSQTISVTNIGGGSLGFTVSVTNATGNWLSVSPSSTVAPAMVTVLANSAGLAQGSYNDTITITPLPSTGATNGPVTIPVGLAVSAPAVPEGGVVNAAIFKATVSPGSIVSLFGTNLSNSTASATSTPLPTTLAGTQVLVNGVPAPLFYVSPLQINLQLPIGLSGSVKVTVISGTTTGVTSTVILTSESPGIFVTSGTQGAVLNQDSSPNSSTNPATVGSVIGIYATGLGSTNPPLAAGEAGSASLPFNVTVDSVTVLINGQIAPVQFSAAAPGFAGLFQINATIPTGTPVDDFVPLQIQINGQSSNTVTFATKSSGSNSQ
jgi:uncharacterized protein (TIGR03437 family)